MFMYYIMYTGLAICMGCSLIMITIGMLNLFFKLINYILDSLFGNKIINFCTRINCYLNSSKSTLPGTDIISFALFLSVLTGLVFMSLYVMKQLGGLPLMFLALFVTTLSIGVYTRVCITLYENTRKRK